MPHADTGERERVTPALDVPSRDGPVVQAIRVDYEPAGFARGAGYDVAGLTRTPARVERLRLVTERLDSEAA